MLLYMSQLLGSLLPNFPKSTQICNTLHLSEIKMVKLLSKVYMHLSLETNCGNKQFSHFSEEISRRNKVGIDLQNAIDIVRITRTEQMTAQNLKNDAHFN